MVPSIGKWQILTFQGAKTPEPILTKLGMVDYIWDPTPHDNFGGGSAGEILSELLRAGLCDTTFTVSSTLM